MEEDRLVGDVSPAQAAFVTSAGTVISLLSGDTVLDRLQAELPEGDEPAAENGEETEKPAFARLRPHTGELLLDDDRYLQETSSAIENRVQAAATELADRVGELDELEKQRLSSLELTGGWFLNLAVAAGLVLMDASTILPAAARMRGADLWALASEPFAQQLAVIGLVAFLLLATLGPAHVLLKGDP